METFLVTAYPARPKTPWKLTIPENFLGDAFTDFTGQKPKHGRLRGEEHLEVPMHESMRALQPHHDESVVEHDAKNLARIL